MYKLFLAIYFCIISFSIAQNSSTRVMTYNIRYANNNFGEEWVNRRDLVAEMMRFHNPHIIGIQEALAEQVDYLSKQFPNYQIVGVGREDGKEGGEFSPLFISGSYSIINFGTFWLSETPNIPSSGWDAALNRIATWALIKEKFSGKSIFVINTHLDHQGMVARLESVKLILSKIKENSNDYPVILTGDFNFTQDSDAYNFIIEDGLLQDSWYKSKYNYGTNITFNDFGKPLTKLVKIDYIFVSNNVNVVHHAVIGDKFNNSYPSDHMPVIVDVEIND